MLWPIERCLFIAGQNMNCDFHFGMTMKTPFLAHPICVHLSLLPVMNLYSSKMMKGAPVGVIKSQDSRLAPKPKGEGQSLMVSDFLTAEWGRLRNNNRCAFSFFYFMLSIDHHAERPTSCSNQGRITTGILI